MVLGDGYQGIFPTALIEPLYLLALRALDPHRAPCLVYFKEWHPLGELGYHAFPERELGELGPEGYVEGLKYESHRLRGIPVGEAPYPGRRKRQNPHGINLAPKGMGGSNEGGAISP